MSVISILLYILGITIGWVLLYHIVKAAVKNGIKEARSEGEWLATSNKSTKTNKPVNAEQIKLQQRYNTGEITFEVYQSEWNKLNI